MSHTAKPSIIYDLFAVSVKHYKENRILAKKSWLSHDNTLAHTSLLFRDFFRQIQLWNHFSYCFPWTWYSATFFFSQEKIAHEWASISNAWGDDWPQSHARELISWVLQVMEKALWRKYTILEGYFDNNKINIDK